LQAPAALSRRYRGITIESHIPILELVRGKLLDKEIERGEVRDDVKARRVNTTFERKKASE
jgi:hypothetical protein